MRKFALFILGLLGIGAIVGIACVSIQVMDLIAIHGSAVNEISIRNRSSQPILRGSIAIRDERHSFGSIAIGQTNRVVFPAKREGSFAVDIIFRSGKTLSSNQLGYLTPGMNLRVIVDVQDNKTELLASEVKQQ